MVLLLPSLFFQNLSFESILVEPESGTKREMDTLCLLFLLVVAVVMIDLAHSSTSALNVDWHPKKGSGADDQLVKDPILYIQERW